MGDVRELKTLTRGQIDAVLMMIGDQAGLKTAEGIRAFMRGDYVIQPLDRRIHVNRSVVPSYQRLDFKFARLDFPAMERHGLEAYTLKEDNFWDYSETGETLLSVYRSLLMEGGEIGRYMNFQDLLAIMDRPLLLRRLVGPDKNIYFLGCVVVATFRDALMVPVLEYISSAGTVKLSLHHLEDVGPGNGRSLVARHRK